LNRKKGTIERVLHKKSFRHPDVAVQTQGEQTAECASMQGNTIWLGGLDGCNGTETQFDINTTVKAHGQRDCNRNIWQDKIRLDNKTEESSNRWLCHCAWFR